MFEPRIVQTRTTDAYEQAEGLSSWNQSYEQLSPGRFEGSVEELDMGDLQVFAESANQSLYQYGSPRPRTVTVGVVHTVDGQGWFCGQSLEVGASVLLSDGSFELVTGKGLKLVAVSIDKRSLVETAASLHGPGWEPASSEGRSMTLGSDRAALRQLIEWPLMLARQRPLLLVETDVHRLLKTRLAEAVLACVGGPDVLERMPSTAASRRRIVSEARDYMRANVDRSIAVPDLCSAIGVSRRTLQYAFEDVLQLSPLTYLRIMRLNRVRRELKKPHHDGVGNVAARCGFWHLPRFAADYRTLFGELPSMTRPAHH